MENFESTDCYDFQKKGANFQQFMFFLSKFTKISLKGEM